VLLSRCLLGALGSSKQKLQAIATVSMDSIKQLCASLPDAIAQVEAQVSVPHASPQCGSLQRLQCVLIFIVVEKLIQFGCFAITLQIAKKDARIEKLEARLARRDASIKQNAEAVEASKSAVQQLAVKDAELSAKDEEIAALTTRLAQFEEAAALMAAAVAQSSQGASASGKKRARTSKSSTMFMMCMISKALIACEQC
jgi:hypothetical protein